MRKSFPFGMAVNALYYNDNVAGGEYRGFIHQHFNWAVLKNALKWPQLEPRRVRTVFTVDLRPRSTMVRTVFTVDLRPHPLWYVGSSLLTLGPIHYGT